MTRAGRTAWRDNTEGDRLRSFRSSGASPDSQLA